ncbi:MAG: branched-chain amino acid ABC transporter permease, partial [Candidatus Bathyarchaeia archaeon]
MARILNSLRTKKLYVLSILILAVFLAFLPHFLSEYMRYIIILCLIYGILTSSYNLVMGYTGQLSFCHAAFYGIGAYCSVLLTGVYVNGLLVSRSLPFWLAFPLAGVISAIFAAGVGYPALKLRGAYFAVTTFFFSWFVYLVFLNWIDVTNGPLGLRGIPPPDPIFGLTFKSYVNYYYLTLVIFIVTVIFLYYLINSNIGKIFIAIREDETLAESLGINAMKYKILSFTIGAFFAGLAGSLFAHFLRYINPTSFSWYWSDIILVMTVVGGCGTIIGPIIGAGLIQALFEFLRPIDPGLRMILVFAASIIAVIFEPRGVVGLGKKMAKVL